MADPQRPRSSESLPSHARASEPAAAVPAATQAAPDAETETREAQEFDPSRIAEALRIARIGFWEHNTDDDRIHLSAEARRITGFAHDRSLRLDEYVARVHPDDREAFIHRAQARLPALRYRFIDHDGKTRHIEGHSETRLDERGRPIQRIGTMRDITDRVLAETALEESERRFRTLARLSPVGTFLADADGSCLYVNERFCEIAGSDAEQAQGSHWSQAIHPDDRQEVMRQFDACVKHSSHFAAEYRLRAPDGRITHVYGQLVAETDSRGQTHGFVGTVTDISERKRAEAERQELARRLRLAETLDAVGTLAGGIAHDFNNLLVPMLTYVDLLADPTLPADEHAAMLNEIRAAARRGRELVRRILSLRGGETEHREEVLINGVLDEVARLLRPSLSAGVNMRARIDTSPVLLQGDPGQLHQVLLNICINAHQELTSQGGGTLELELHPRAGDDGTPPPPPDLPHGQYCVIAVRDDGRGIAPEVLPRIFDPFFTTKGPGQGTGFGLAMAHGIVRAHGGALDVRTELGRGTEFRIFLPRSEAPVRRPSPSPAPRLARIRARRVLLVDDEPSVATAAARLLRRTGYEVETFLSPLKALTTFRQQPGRYDLALLDHNMPELSGIELGRALIEQAPALPLVLYTGHVTPTLLRDARNAGFRGHIEKPFDPATLVERIEQLIGD
ncbi:MAG: PAS domain S-box protein [Myxococcales bacterium]|nr:PAS domain S-box protein [Myxococcales bacterium]